MKTDEIHIALQKNQQIFKLGIVEDIQKEITAGKKVIADLNANAKTLMQRIMQIEDDKQTLDESISAGKNSITQNKNYTSPAFDVQERLNYIQGNILMQTKELGVDAKDVKGFTESRNIYTQISAALKDNNTAKEKLEQIAK